MASWSRFPTRCLVSAVMLGVLAPVEAHPQSVGVQQAIHLMESRGDYAAALVMLEEVFEANGNDRRLSASCLLYIGLCQEKLGQSQAEATYERLIVEYGDYREIVGEARNRLAYLHRNGLAQPGAAVSRRIWGGHAYGVSPDGSFLAVLDDRGGNLAAVDVATGAVRLLTTEGDWANESLADGSAISPDGRSVAYNWWDWRQSGAMELRLLEVDRPEPRTVFRDDRVESIWPYTWTPDGTQILVEAWESEPKNQIASVSIDGTYRVLKRLGPLGTNGISVSPDGRFVTFDAPSLTGADRDIFVMNLDGSNDRPLITGPSSDVTPVWTPDGGGLLFMSDRGGSMALWGVPMVGDEVASDAVMVRPNMEGVALRNFAADGSLYFDLRFEGPSIYLTEVDPESMELVAPIRRISVLNVGNSLQPTWSPDGTELAFAQTGRSTRLGENNDNLAILNLPSGNFRYLSPVALRNIRAPRWAPDGRSVRVRGWGVDGGYGVYDVDARTGDVLRHVPFHVGNPRYSHDLDTLYYITQEDGWSLVLARDVATGTDAELFRIEGDAYNLRISYAATRLAFELGRGDQQHRVMMVGTDGSAARELIRWEDWQGGRLWGWTGDDSAIVYRRVAPSPSNRDGAETPRDILVIPVDGGAARELRIPTQDPRDFRFHPDSRRLAFTGGNQLHETWVMENFLPAALR